MEEKNEENLKKLENWAVKDRQLPKRVISGGVLVPFILSQSSSNSEMYFLLIRVFTFYYIDLAILS